MSERALARQSTLGLARKLVEASTEFELVNSAEWWRKPHWWALKTMKVLDFIRRRRLRALSRYRAAVVGELAVRYHGVIRDLFKCAKVATPFETHWANIWLEIHGRAARTREPGLFSTCLWEVQRRLGATVQELKPKFMLRQFVDDMPDGGPRAALQLRAYSHEVRWPEASPEAARMAREGYELLHERVRARAENLELLTDGELNAGMVADIRSTHVQYHRWLFQEC
jgi:hypothetical protein